MIQVNLVLDVDLIFVVQAGLVNRSSYPVSLLIEETFSLVENLLVGLFLGDVGGKVGSVGVDLQNRERVSLSGAFHIAVVYSVVAKICDTEITVGEHGN